MLEFIFSQYKGVETHLIVLEAFGVIFGLFSVIFSKKRNILVYPTGIVSTIIYVYLLWKSVLYGDMLINAYYTIMSIYGWWIWSKNMKNEASLEVKIEITRLKEWIFCFYLGLFSVIFVGLVYYFKPFFRNNFSAEGVTFSFEYFVWTDYVDILTTSIFLIGMWLMAQRKIENWIFWIVGDIISVPLYYHKGLVFSSIQYIIFTIIAWLALKEWRKNYNKQISI